MNKLEQINELRMERIKGWTPSGKEMLSIMLERQLRNLKRVKFKVSGIKLSFYIGGQEVWYDEYFHPEGNATEESKEWAGHMLDFATVATYIGKVI